jgi:hypothetical protein
MRLQVGNSPLAPVVVCPSKVHVSQPANYSNRYHPCELETEGRHVQITETEEKYISCRFFHEIGDKEKYSSNDISATFTK